MKKHDHSHHHSDATVSVDAMTAKDPVCGMTVKLDEGKHSREHKGETYYFCSQKCHDKFATDPAHFVSGKQEQESLPKGVKYTCPMHPEIVRDAPGECPICGMTLEPMGVPAADEGPNPELVDFKRRFWIGAVLTVPLLLLTMGPLVGLGFVRDIFGERATLWIELILGTPVILWAGWPFFVRGVKSVINRSLNMFTLIGMGVGAAYLFSVVAVLVPGIFPDGFRDAEGHVGVYFEAGAVIVVLVLLGQVMELGARERTGSAIRALLDLAPKTARVIREDGQEEEIPLEDVKVGDRLRVRPGDKAQGRRCHTRRLPSAEESWLWARCCCRPPRTLTESAICRSATGPTISLTAVISSRAAGPAKLRFRLARAFTCCFGGASCWLLR
jgi:Cu+-exporting ATPase